MKHLLAKLKETRPYLKVHYLYNNRSYHTKVNCTLCGRTIQRPVNYLLTYDCLCQKGTKISKAQKASHTHIQDICKEQKVRLIGNYNTMNTAVAVECLVCGHIWDAYFSNLRKGHRCPECAPERVRLSVQRKYGVDNPFQDPATRAKIQATMLKRYGVKYTLQNKSLLEKMKRANVGRYGVEHNMQRPEVHSKAMASAYSYKVFTFKDYSWEVQGYESRAIRWLLQNGVEPYQILEGRRVPIHYVYNSKSRVYYPDLWLPDINTIVEVKSVWTLAKNLEQNLAKRAACRKQGYEFKFLVMDNNGNRLSNKAINTYLKKARKQKAGRQKARI